MKYYAPFYPEGYCHVVSRATGYEKLFKWDENYHFFLRRFVQYISPVADTFCYTQLPNHFHFLIQVKPESHLAALYEMRKKAPPPGDGWQHKIVMQRSPTCSTVTPNPLMKDITARVACLWIIYDG